LTTKDIRDIILRSIASPSNGADCMCEGTGFFHAFPWDAQDIFDADKNGSLDKSSDLAVQTTMAPVTSS